MTASISPEFLALQELLAGRYSIERELGRGGMGIVLLARDVALDRPVAIKLLPPHLATRPDERDRFLQEARTAAGLAHPNIVPIHLVEAHGDLVFFVMGFVDGETLRDRVERAGPLPPRLATKLLQEVAWELGREGRKPGLGHRDRALHEPRASVRRAGGCAQRPLLLGRDVLLRPHRPGTLRGCTRARDHHETRLRDRATGPAAPARGARQTWRRGRPAAPQNAVGAVSDRGRSRAGRGRIAGPRLSRPAAAPCLRAERASLHPGPVDVGARWERDGDNRCDPPLSTGRGGAPNPEGRLHVRRHSGGPACRTAGAAGGGRSHQAAPLVPAAGLVVVPDLGRKSRTLVLLARWVGPQGDCTRGPALDRADRAGAGTLGALRLSGAAGCGAAT